MFYLKFSALMPDQSQYQLKFYESAESVSISLQSKNEFEDLEAILSISEDTVRILKIKSFEDLRTCFTFDTPLELYTNLLTLMLICCNASLIFISPSEALNVTLGKKLKNWRDLVVYLCSLSPKEIPVFENKQNAVCFLKTTFQIQDNTLITDGLYKSRTPYQDLLESIRAVLDTLAGVLKINDIVLNPFPRTL